MRSRFLRLPSTTAFVPAVLAAMAVACAPAGGGPADFALENTSWTVASIAGAPTLPAFRPTLTFAADGTVSGTTGCNQYSGPYKRDGQAISFGLLAATLIGCDGDRGLQEGAFIGALRGVTSWRHGPDGLVLSGPTGDIVAGEGVAEGPPGGASGSGDPGLLAGTSWTLHEMGGTADFAHLVPTLMFGTDGTVSGFSGCNQFSGPVTLTEGAFSLGQLITTKRACTRPGSVVEPEYLDGLVGAKTWSMDPAGQLVLDGALPMTFAPAEPTP